MSVFPQKATISIHEGHRPDPTTHARGVPVFRTTSFLFRDTGHAARLFDLKEVGHVYSRISNPTTEVLERRFTALERGGASVAVASGPAAVFFTVVTIAKAGDHLVSARQVTPTTRAQFEAVLPDLGITATFADAQDPRTFEAAIQPETKLLFVQTLGSPDLEVADLGALAEVARRHGLPLVVDGTPTGPTLLRPLDYGASIVINSLTHWTDGRGTSVGGMVTDSGRFDWSTGKFPAFTQPDKNYHGLRWALDLPEDQKPVAFSMRLRTVPLRNLGFSLSPDDSWNFLQGLETLDLRMARHSENALAAARLLVHHPKVVWVGYPGLRTDQDHPWAELNLTGGGGGLVAFSLAKGLSPEDFLAQLKLFGTDGSEGSVASQAQEAEPGVIRLSVGLENIIDLLEDLDQALARV